VSDFTYNFSFLLNGITDGLVIGRAFCGAAIRATRCSAQCNVLTLPTSRSADLENHGDMGHPERGTTPRGSIRSGSDLPTVHGGEFSTPSEDIGGVSGYEQFLEALSILTTRSMRI
jgi:hypothetical protein